MTPTTRTGIGWDSHRLAEGRRLVIGGVQIPHELGLMGHSDADVLAHAVMDALLGAAGLGDIGQHFPDSDPAYEDADSMQLLGVVVERAAAAGVTPVHVDVTLLMERPKLGPHRDAIRTSLAGGLGIDPSAVNIKASTGERMGFIGREEGVAALAVVTATTDA